MVNEGLMNRFWKLPRGLERRGYKLNPNFITWLGTLFELRQQPTRHQGREKIGKICKISGEKLVFSPQISYIILRWNAVNAVKLCKFTARVSGDLTKIQLNSPLKYVISPPLQGFEALTSCMSSTSSSTAPSFTNFWYFCFEYKWNSFYFL